MASEEEEIRALRQIGASARNRPKERDYEKFVRGQARFGARNRNRPGNVVVLVAFAILCIVFFIVAVSER